MGKILEHPIVEYYHDRETRDREQLTLKGVIMDFVLALVSVPDLTVGEEMISSHTDLAILSFLIRESICGKKHNLFTLF